MRCMISCRGISNEKCLTLGFLRFPQRSFIVLLDILWDQIDQTPSGNAVDKHVRQMLNICLTGQLWGVHGTGSLVQCQNSHGLPFLSQMNFFMGIILIGVGQKFNYVKGSLVCTHQSHFLSPFLSPFKLYSASLEGKKGHFIDMVCTRKRRHIFSSQNLTQDMTHTMKGPKSWTGCEQVFLTQIILHGGS